jgi:hypothetical protein
MLGAVFGVPVAVVAAIMMAVLMGLVRRKS